MKKAFTLAELLIVITIIGILTTVFIGNYQGAIQHSRVNASANEIKSILKSQQSKASNGILQSNSNQEKTIVCTGVYFDKTATVSIQTFLSPFDSESQTCINDQSQWTYKVEVVVYEDVKISKLINDEIEDLTIYFAPPRAQMSIWHSQNSTKYDKEFQIILNNSNYKQFTKEISINSASGKIE